MINLPEGTPKRLAVTLNQFTLVNYFDIHQDATLLNSINYQNSKRWLFYIREQDKVSFTASSSNLFDPPTIQNWV